MKATLTVLSFAIVALFSAPQALAAPCGDDPIPFDDLNQNDSFCTDAAWAKNALITTGCASPPNPPNWFCPNDLVTRAQMVLFLRRTAEATFPVSRFAESVNLPAGDLDTTGLSSCTTTAINIPATANGYFAQVDAAVSLQGDASAADVQITVTFMVAGVPFGPSHLVNQIVTVPAGQWRHASLITGLRPVFPGTSNAWRIDLTRVPGSTSVGELAGLRCQIKVIARMP